MEPDQAFVTVTTTDSDQGDQTMMLEGKTAVVTGIGPGMGRDISLGLAREGADVVLVARSDKVLPGVAEEIEALGRRAVAVYGNIADAAECARMAEEVRAALGGRLDILVNSAFHGGRHESFEDADLEKWHRPMNVNYFGTLQFTQAVLPQLKAAAEAGGDARIVMVNTMSVHHIEAGAGSYAGSKAALGGGDQDPGPGAGRATASGSTRCTPGTSGATASRSTSSGRPRNGARASPGRTCTRSGPGRPAWGTCPHSSEIAGAVVFFASPLAKCVTGTALPVNAGHWLPPSA